MQVVLDQAFIYAPELQWAAGGPTPLTGELLLGWLV